MKHAKLARLAALCTLTLGSATGLFALTTSPGSASGGPTLYNSIESPLPGNVVSWSFEATETSEFGNAITLASESLPLNNVVVTMSSWGCQSGNWSTNNCATTAGSTFTEPITLNLYNTDAAGDVGSRFASVTQTFTIPYRPSLDAACSSSPDPGGWMDASGTCHNGLAVNITFSLASLNLTPPHSFIYGIAYNTSDYGASPYGDATACHSSPGGCGYDSLNVGLSSDGTDVTVGSDNFPGRLYDNTKYAPYYCDNGAAGTGTFRLDSPPPSDPANCASSVAGWSINGGGAPYYVPAVQFNQSLPTATSLTTQPAVLELLPALTLLAGPMATLNTPSGPLAGQVVTFTTPSGGALCSATTNEHGLATCGSGEALASLLSLGYVAHYAGTASYAASSAKGSLIVVLGVAVL